MTKVALTVRLDAGLRKALDDLAEESRRSITGEIEHMIEERAKRGGLLPTTWKRTRLGAARGNG